MMQHLRCKSDLQPSDLSSRGNIVKIIYSPQVVSTNGYAESGQYRRREIVNKFKILDEFTPIKVALY